MTETPQPYDAAAARSAIEADAQARAQACAQEYDRTVDANNNINKMEAL